jgi:hypothetical protein
MVNNFHAERPAMTTVYFEERTHLNHHTQLFTPKIQGIKKKTWDKIFKNTRRNFKSPKRLNSNPKIPRKKEGFIKMLKKN